MTKLAGLLALTLTAAAAAAQVPPRTTPPPPQPAAAAPAAPARRAPLHPRLSPLLNQLWASRFAPHAAPAGRSLDRLLTAGGAVEVVLDSRPGAAVEAATLADQLGGVVTAVHGDLVFAALPLGQLPLVASSDSVLRVRTPYRSQPHVVSEGVGVHAADLLQAQGLTGQGVKVGVLDCGGFVGYEACSAPSCRAASPCGLAASTRWAPGPTAPVAPRSSTTWPRALQLFLAHDGSEAEFYAAVDWLVTQGVDVISYSCGWIGPFPFDGSGLPHNPVSAAVSDARADGVLWVNSAGNYAEGDGYSATYLQLPGYDWHSFDGEWGDGFFLWAGQDVSLALTWNDWPVGPQTQGSSQDYNMDVWRWDGAAWIVDYSSANPQAGVAGQVPYEEISFTSPVDSWYYVTISKFNATANHDLNLRSFGPGFLHSQPERSVSVPAESQDALALGAGFWADLGLEAFSSRGPTLGPGGTLTGGALKPDLAGADGTSGVTYSLSNGIPWPTGTGFFGTSAACPQSPAGPPAPVQAIVPHRRRARGGAPRRGRRPRRPRGRTPASAAADAARQRALRGRLRRGGAPPGRRRGTAGGRAPRPSGWIPPTIH